MFNLYNGELVWNEEQKLAYIKLLIYLAKSDNNPDTIEKVFIKKMMIRFNLPADSLVGLAVPASLDDIYDVARPIKERAMAIDLLHTLWFAASIDEVIADEEIKIIRSLARILNIDDDTVLVINNFVLDEITFMQQAEDVLETQNIRC
jgi:uncharacterized tellurite resistance protein B-like protein